MPLTLVTGPANAAKAGEVLGGLRARLEDEPILVVPAFADVEHAQRELAERGAVFGASVLRFDWLFRVIAERAGYGEPVASSVQRELILEAAVGRARLDVLAESAGQPGFVRAAAGFVAELGGAGVDPARLGRSLRDWAPRGRRQRYAEEVAALYGGYRDGLAAAGLVDSELFAWRALDALRREPHRWGATPLFAYGFDDFTALELDALETLAQRVGVDVTVSLPFEAGRAAFRAVAGVHARLSEIAVERRVLPALDDHYAEGSRPALHRLERGLFEPNLPPRVEAGASVAFHTAGGERAELELIGARLLELLRRGVEPGDVAVVLREPGRYASLIDQIFGSYGIPYSIDRSLPLAHTSLGRGLLALLRCAGPGGTAEDLLTYLRTPGRLALPALADRLEAEVRREGAHRLAQARELWERQRWSLEELNRLAAASGTGATFVAELERQLARLFAGPYRRRAAVLSGSQLEDARAFAAAASALSELRSLLRPAGPHELEPARLHDLLAELRVRVGENPQPDRVQVAAPESIRARRFEAVLVCGLQEGEFPRPGSPEPFLTDDDRRAIASASGLVLPAREDRLDRERYLFYVCASRAERLLVLSSRTSDEEGRPQAPSFFLDDVRELLAAAPTRSRSLSEITWAPEEAPTAAEWDRALAARGARREERPVAALTAEPLIAELAGRAAVSAGALERYADCPVKWLVRDVLRPDALEPDPEAMVRGDYAHTVLERTYRRLREETGERRVTRRNLARAERILLDELRVHGADFKLSPKRTRVRAAARRLEFDLLRHLGHEAAYDGRFEPEHLELKFGYGEGHEPVEIAAGLRVRGRIDRVDTSDGMALVVDYKSGRKVDTYKVASWEPENRFQAALYMLVVERLLNKRAVGGVYTALGGDDPRPRGMVAAGVDALGTGFVGNDRLEPDDFRAKLEWALGRIRETDAAMRRGDLRCSPDSCAWNGGCSYPSICRSSA